MLQINIKNIFIQVLSYSDGSLYLQFKDNTAKNVASVNYLI